ncbi:autotransporter outer membrane beta-barrel domain-containing protein [Enterobacteriaceae bacterium Kacie_13]|nr:autotransporter outer membrane beta-barrel domain-containing protein [Enterobacteriaceae bacterium Kacie_13]
MNAISRFISKLSPSLFCTSHSSDASYNEQRGSKNIAEVRAGVDGQLTQRVNLWGNIGQQMGSESYRDTSATLGVKVSF